MTGFEKKDIFKNPIKKNPLISIITIVYNGEKYINQTMQSVFEQSYKNIEYIIVDGNSTDNTLNIVNQYKNKIALIISEPDSGISDAMNKGIQNCHGEYVFFLNSDDYLRTPTSLESIQHYISEGYDVITCGVLFGENKKKVFPKGFTFWMNFKFGNPHQGIVCRKELFDLYGLFGCDFKINMDYDFFLRIYRKGVKAIKVPVFLSVMRDVGISSQCDYMALSNRFDEEKNVHKKNCTLFFMKFIYSCYWFVYMPYRKLKFILHDKKKA